MRACHRSARRRRRSVLRLFSSGEDGSNSIDVTELKALLGSLGFMPLRAMIAEAPGACFEPRSVSLLMLRLFRVVGPRLLLTSALEVRLKGRAAGRPRGKASSRATCGASSGSPCVPSQRASLGTPSGASLQPVFWLCGPFRASNRASSRTFVEAHSWAFCRAFRRVGVGVCSPSLQLASPCVSVLSRL